MAQSHAKTESKRRQKKYDKNNKRCNTIQYIPEF